jgi:hypothetical protein
MVAISQSRAVHEQASRLLETLRAAMPAAGDALSEEKHSKRLATRDRRVDQALEKTMPRLSIIQTPLRQVADIFESQAKITIVIDHRALADAGMDVESIEFSADYMPTSFRAALERLLSSRGLGFAVDHEALVITTPERAQTMSRIEAYSVADLLAAEGGEAQAERGRKLMNLIVSAVDRTTWDEVGGPNRVQFIAAWNLLVVSAPGSTHRKVADTLEKLRDAKRRQAETKVSLSDAGAATDDPVEVRVFGVSAAAGDSLESAKEMVEAIRELTPEIQDNPGGDFAPYIRALPGRIIVRHRRSAIDKVEALLEKIEASPAHPAARSAPATQ